MRVLWTHNFNPNWPNSQVYMNLTARSVRAKGIELELLYLGNLRSPLNLRRAAHLARRAARGFDLVHAQYGSACGLVTASVRGVPKVLSLRGNDWAVHDDRFGFCWVHTRLAHLMTRRSAHSYDCLLAVSDRLARQARVGLPGVRIETLPSPVDLDAFLPVDRLEARRRLGLDGSGEKWVLFNALNLHDPIKRYPLARVAFERAQRRMGNLRLRVATDLPHEMIPTFVAACDLILCTSETEGWPNSVKEALACGLPFVATDVSDLAQIAAAEPSCRICPADPDALSNAICEVLSGPAPTGLRRHVVPMGLQETGRRLSALYQSLTARQTRPVGTSRS